MRPSGSSRLFALAALLFFVSCSRCGKTASGRAELLRLLPANAEMVVVIPDLASLGEKIKILEGLKAATFAAQLQGFSDAQQLTGSLMSQFGVDVRSSESMAKAGLDPSRGFGFAVVDGRKSYFVVGVKDSKALLEKVTQLAKSRLGARHVSTPTVAGKTVTHFSRTPGGPPLLGLLVENDFAYVSTSGIEDLPSRATLQEGQSLLKDDNLKAALGRLPAERDGYVYMPKRSLFPERAGEGALTTFLLNRQGLSVRSDLRWNYTGDALKAVARAEGPSLFFLGPSDAFAVVRYGADPAKLGPLLPYVLPKAMAEQLKAAGIDVRADILEAVKPGALLTLSLAPNVQLGAGMPAFDIRRTNPFRFINLSGIVEAVDPAKLPALTAKLPALGPVIGARITPTPQNGRTLYLTYYQAGEGVHFGHEGKYLAAGAPVNRLEALLDRAKTPPDAAQGTFAGSPARAALEQQGIAVSVDLQRLAAGVKALPPEAWPLGGFPIKAATERWLDAASDLVASHASISSTQNALQSELTLRFAAQ